MKKTLSNIINQYKEEEFNWGRFDCCIFTAKVVEEFTGKELPYWKNVLNYTDFKSSIRTLKKLGCNKLEDLPSIILDTEKLSMSEVKLGYPVYYINEDGIGILGVQIRVTSLSPYFSAANPYLQSPSTKKKKKNWIKKA